jgi:hypothetical protein
MFGDGLSRIDELVRVYVYYETLPAVRLLPSAAASSFNVILFTESMVVHREVLTDAPSLDPAWFFLAQDPSFWSFDLFLRIGVHVFRIQGLSLIWLSTLLSRGQRWGYRLG